MLTPEQEKWIAHLRDDNKTEIYPFDKDSGKKFQKVKNRILSLLGGNVRVEHRGASSLGISGQGELDIYVPVPADKFDLMVASLENIFGKPGSIYPLERARFVTDVDGTKAEVFVVNEKGKSWVDGCMFENYLKTHLESLKVYEQLKESARGLSTRAYYRKKTEFINEILEKVDNGL
jgi:GrpB-like predicted nucleotidyltransferase (UPF0157 family)